MNRRSETDKACRGEARAISLKHYIAYLLRILGYARIWPNVSFPLFKIFLSTGATIIFISGNFLLLLSEIVALTMNSDLKLFANIIGVIGMHAGGLIKWCYCIWKNREITDIVAQLEKCHVLCQKIDKSEEGNMNYPLLQISEMQSVLFNMVSFFHVSLTKIFLLGHRTYRNEMEYARKYSIFFVWWWTIATIYGILHWCANPLLLEGTFDQINSINHTFRKRNLPFVGWYPLNTDDVFNYACLYLVQIISGISPAFGIICYDAFYVTMLMVVGAQFQYINITMTKIDFDNVPEIKFILESKLKNCVDFHTEILKFLEMLQTFSGPTMFVQCIQTLVILCLTSFEASVIKLAIDMESILKLWSLLEYLLCTALQLYGFCFFATQLEYLGLQIAHSVYSCGWELVGFAKKAQVDFGKHCDIGRLVQTIMVRSQRSIVLTGGPFYVLSLETFRVIMGMALSNSVILRTISDLDE